MAKSQYRHEINCDADRFWQVYFDHDFVDKLYDDGLGFISHEILKEEGDVASGLSREMRTVQPLDAPGPVKKVFGNTATNLEQGTYDPEAGEWRFTLTPSQLHGRIHIKGVVHLEPAGEDKVTQVTDMEYSVKVPLVGGVFEKTIAKESESAYKKQADFMNGYIAES